jgi:hypothetical protein
MEKKLYKCEYCGEKKHDATQIRRMHLAQHMSEKLRDEDQSLVHPDTVRIMDELERSLTLEVMVNLFPPKDPSKWRF